ncbi:MAG TPA: HD domain-containing phosphohydrolase [Thermoanaerobaculia bacterium]|nr:HD domain-containing phosphohydrolase [Thermoanaerobaculia bacterium]
MLPELKSIEAQLKQVLYGCVEHVQATKAALYLSSTHDLSQKTYEIVTSYQFNAADRKTVTGNDDLVDRLHVKRDPFIVNGLGADQRLAEILFRQGTDRLLATPLFSRGRLVGFIDMRDKAGKKPFEPNDVNAARNIADQMLKVLAANKLFGLAPIALVDEPVAPSTPAPTAAPMIAPPPISRGQFFSNEALKAVESARQLMAKRQLVQQSVNKHVLSDDDLEPVRLLLPAALAIPGAVLACFSAIGHINNPQLVVATSTVTDAAMEKLQTHLETWLKRTNQLRPVTHPQVSYPFAMNAPPLVNLAPIVSAPVTVQSIEGLVLTFAFERPPDVVAQRALKRFLRQLELAMESAIASASSRKDRDAIAEYLLEPDFQKFPDLVEHSREVSVLAQKLARLMELPPAQVETVRLAALVHDAGLRLLDHERLHKRLTLTTEELRGIAEHPVVGAALVEPLLGADVAQAVLRHHERVDGKGYPSRMSGQQIPIASRILQVADAWIAMTARHSYQVPISRDEATKRLREGAGTQFDAAIVERFLRALPELI